MELEKTIRLCELFDLYQNLLSMQCQKVLGDYLNFNLTLTEIATNMGKTRQAVFELVDKASKKLEKLEQCLGMYVKKQKLQNDLQNLKCLCKNKKAEQQLDKILEEL